MEQTFRDEDLTKGNCDDVARKVLSAVMEKNYYAESSKLAGALLALVSIAIIGIVLMIPCIALSETKTQCLKRCAGTTMAGTNARITCENGCEKLSDKDPEEEVLEAKGVEILTQTDKKKSTVARKTKGKVVTEENVCDNMKGILAVMNCVDWCEFSGGFIDPETEQCQCLPGYKLTQNDYGRYCAPDCLPTIIQEPDNSGYFMGFPWWLIACMITFAACVIFILILSRRKEGGLTYAHAEKIYHLARIEAEIGVCERDLQKLKGKEEKLKTLLADKRRCEDDIRKHESGMGRMSALPTIPVQEDFTPDPDVTRELDDPAVLDALTTQKFREGKDRLKRITGQIEKIGYSSEEITAEMKRVERETGDLQRKKEELEKKLKKSFQ